MSRCVLFLFALARAFSFEAHIALTNASYGIQFSLRNTENQPITVLILGTPLEPTCNGNVLCTDMFTVVTDPNVTATYIGIQRKKAYPPSAFKTLQPNQVITAQVNLSYGYWFPQPGTYRVSLKSSILVYAGQSTNLSLFTRSSLPHDEILLLSVRNPPPLPERLRPRNGTKQNIGGFVTCTANQQAQLTALDPITLQNALQAYNYLASGNCSERPEYVVWFGVCDDIRYQTVKTNLLAIINRIRAGTYAIECTADCDAWTIAWVWTTIPVIHLCPLYWQMPKTPCNMDSQSGTIIHETSHWVDVAGTDDLCYGDWECQQMAKLSPKNATMNADSYAMFCGSCPIPPKTVTFATYNSSTLGSLTKKPTQQNFDVSCKYGTKKITKCPTTIVKQALVGPSYTFAPSIVSVQSTLTLATSQISITLTNTNPIAPLYLYVYAWPKGTYTFGTKDTGMSIVSGAVATTRLFPGARSIVISANTWSGIIKFPSGKTSLGWIGKSRNSKALLTFTIAWVYRDSTPI